MKPLFNLFSVIIVAVIAVLILTSPSYSYRRGYRYYGRPAYYGVRWYYPGCGYSPTGWAQKDTLLTKAAGEIVILMVSVVRTVCKAIGRVSTNGRLETEIAALSSKENE